MKNNVKKMWVVAATYATGETGYLLNPLSPDVQRMTGTVVSELTPNACDAELYWRKNVAEEEAERVARDLPAELTEQQLPVVVKVIAVDVTITESAA